MALLIRLSHCSGCGDVVAPRRLLLCLQRKKNQSFSSNNSLHSDVVFRLLLFFVFFLLFHLFTSSVVCLLKISGNILGNLVLTIKVVSCVVRSNGTCPVAKELPFRTEACSSSSCPNSARLSFSLDQLQELTSTTWGLECSVQVCYSEVGDETE